MTKMTPEYVSRMVSRMSFDELTEEFQKADDMTYSEAVKWVEQRGWTEREVINEIKNHPERFNQPNKS